MLVEGLGFRRIFDLGFRVVEERIVGLCWELKSGLMSFLMAKLVEKNMWDFRGFRVKRKGLIWGCKEEGNKRIFWCSGGSP